MPHSRTKRNQDRSLLNLCECLETRRLLTNYTVTPLSDLDSSIGSFAGSSLALDRNGNLFGTTTSGGMGGQGTIFELPAGTHTVKALQFFEGLQTQGDYGSVISDSAGDLFGTLSGGGANSAGSIFNSPPHDVFTNLYSFSTTDPASQYGSAPTGALISYTANNAGKTELHLLGINTLGGSNDTGTIYDYAYGTNNPPTVLVSLPKPSIKPGSGLSRDPAGNIFGTSINGGSNKDGAIFEVPAGGGVYLTAASFNGSDGSFPVAPPIFDPLTNAYYGTTFLGGANNLGVLYKYANGVITDLIDFNGTNGGYPNSGLIEDSRGNLFGTSAEGGPADYGTIFEIPAGTINLKTIFQFDRTNFGYEPDGGLTADSAGNFYGVTALGGPNNDGVIYEVSPNPPTQLTIPTTVSGTKTNESLAPITVNVEDSSNDVVETDTSTVTMAIASGPAGATLGGTVSEAAVNGVATFSDLTLSVPGTYTLIASDGTLITATANSFDMVAPMPHLSFAAQPINLTAGVRSTTPIVLDLLGADNSVQTKQKPMRVMMTATIPAGKTLRLAGVARKGIATFKNLTLTVAGSYAFTASVTGFGSLASDSFIVSPTTTRRIVFSLQPVNTTSTSPVVAQIKLTDRFGNLAINDSSVVTMKFVGKVASAVLGGTSSVAAINGIAAFPNLMISTPRKAYQLEALDGKLRAISKRFAII